MGRHLPGLRTFLFLNNENQTSSFLHFQAPFRHSNLRLLLTILSPYASDTLSALHNFAFRHSSRQPPPPPNSLSATLPAVEHSFSGTIPALEPSLSSTIPVLQPRFLALFLQIHSWLSGTLPALQPFFWHSSYRSALGRYFPVTPDVDFRYPPGTPTIASRHPSGTPAITFQPSFSSTLPTDPLLDFRYPSGVTLAFQ